jgi:hypothetical protein
MALGDVWYAFQRVGDKVLRVVVNGKQMPYIVVTRYYDDGKLRK